MAATSVVLECSVELMKRFYPLLIVASTSVIIVITYLNCKSQRYGIMRQLFENLSQLEVRKRYAEFLFLRLLAEIDRIQTKYVHISDKLRKEHDGGGGGGHGTHEYVNYMLAHEEMRLAIETFRKDARRLLTPNELEVALPMEEVYCMALEDERLVQRSRFYHMNFTVDDRFIEKLLNP